MKPEILAGRKLENELEFNASRSSGPGGQNVNKVSSRIELRFDIEKSAILSEEEKTLLQDNLRSKISKDGILIIVAQTERSQFENRQNAVEKFYRMVSKALTPVKKRKKTSPTLSSKRKRKENKVHQSLKKAGRKIAYED